MPRCPRQWGSGRRNGELEIASETFGLSGREPLPATTVGRYGTMDGMKGCADVSCCWKHAGTDVECLVHLRGISRTNRYSPLPLEHDRELTGREKAILSSLFPRDCFNNPSTTQNHPTPNHHIDHHRRLCLQIHFPICSDQARWNGSYHYAAG